MLERRESEGGEGGGEGEGKRGGGRGKRAADSLTGLQVPE